MKEQHPFPINNDQTSEQVDVSAVELLQSGEKVFAPELIEGNALPVFHDGPGPNPNDVIIREFTGTAEITQADVDSNPELKQALESLGINTDPSLEKTHEVTQADLDANPELKGVVEVGENVQIVEEPLTGKTESIEAGSQESGVASTATGIPSSDEGAE